MGCFCSPAAMDSVFFLLLLTIILFFPCVTHWLLEPRVCGDPLHVGGYHELLSSPPFEKTNSSHMSTKDLCPQRPLLPWEPQLATGSRRVLLHPGEGPLGGGSPGRPSHAAG